MPAGIVVDEVACQRSLGGEVIRGAPPHAAERLVCCSAARHTDQTDWGCLVISVLIAAVGIFGTAIGAVLTAAISAKTEGRRQLALERQQIREEQQQKYGQLRELRLEHLRWRRERRQAAYLDLLTEVGTADRANQQYFRELAAGSEPVPVDEARLAEIRSLFKAAERTTYKVVLEGPGSVAEVAQALTDQLGLLVSEVRSFARASASSAPNLADHRGLVETVGQRFIAAQRTFLETARTALDEIIDAT